MSRREQAKARRRDQIIQATYDILATQGDEPLSMELIAKRSGLSIMTIYNLVGSKNKLLLDVLNRVTEGAADHLRARPSTDPLDRILGIMESARETIAEAQSLWVPLSQVLFTFDNSELRHAAKLNVRSLWIELFQDAIKEGFINEQFEPETIAHSIEAVFYANYFEFADGTMTLNQFIDQTQCGVCLVLLGACNRQYHSRLMTRFLHWQDLAE